MGKKIDSALFNLMGGLRSFHAFRANLAERLVRYEEVSEEDTDGLSQLYKDSLNKSSNNLSTSMKRLKKRKGSGYIFKACVDKRILGAVFLILIFEDEFSPYSPGWWIFSLFVQERYRRLGIGKNLLCLTIQKAESLGAAEVNLIVAEDNEAANNLYRKMGFERNSNPKIEELLKQESKQGKSDRVFMTIKLNNIH